MMLSITGQVIYSWEAMGMPGCW